MYMKENEAAKYIGMSVHTLRDWRAKKIGPEYHKLGRAVRYTEKQLDDWAKGKKDA